MLMGFFILNSSFLILKIMLEIKDLHASINGKEILKGIDLTIRDGEVHADGTEWSRKKYAEQYTGGASSIRGNAWHHNF